MIVTNWSANHPNRYAAAAELDALARQSRNGRNVFERLVVAAAIGLAALLAVFYVFGPAETESAPCGIVTEDHVQAPKSCSSLDELDAKMDELYETRRGGRFDQ